MSPRRPRPPALTLPEALRRLAMDGRVELPGRRSDLTTRWLRTHRGRQLRLVPLLVIGFAAAVVGVTAEWSIMSGILGYTGLGLAFVVLLRMMFIQGATGRWEYYARRGAEKTPVVVDPAGIILRGVGPLPWSFVMRPERRLNAAKYDISGDSIVMPLTPAGYAYVQAQAPWWRRRVGTIPDLNHDVTVLLLPGIAGLTEVETAHLFATAHEKFGRMRR